TADQPELPGLLAEMRTVADEYEDRVLLGELHLTLERVAELGGRRGLDIAMNFSLIDVPWRGRSLGELVRRYEDALPPGAWPNWVLSNHDRSRVATRVGEDLVRGALTLLLTLRGTPTLYYGDELGLPDAPVAASRVRDCAALRTGDLTLGRDPERMPMPWTRDRNAGFTGPDVEPWLPVPEWATRVSVAAQEVDPHSTLRMVRSLVRYRQASDALLHGSVTVLSDDDELLVLLRESPREAVVIAISLTDRSRRLALPAGSWTTEWVTGPGPVGHVLTGALVLPAFEAMILRRTVAR
ncbi:MAG: alpha-amylase family glycosyl hydrolase, partial [Cellulomonas sp.]